ncbi:pirin family protein [Sandarakinorhabdus sp.]|uniref:pirin family protein n=1 Tax=Sandarakinorhabdus sp. TaxID=1916663 RepID=UPI00286E1EEC|nr:pirin family protein [Sandarakinorhabdus sp.]
MTVRTLHRPADARGKADHGWLKSAHSFSFGQYHDPNVMGFRALRVINEDWIAGGGGFPTHGHSDMEIVTYVLDGALAHKDSLGTGAVIRPGEAQRMSAGRGIQHSEFNASADETVHLLQIWLLPRTRGGDAGYEQKALPPVAPDATQIDIIASPDGGDAAVTINSDASIARVVIAPGGSITVPITRGNAWLQAARGAATAGNQALAAGDGFAAVGLASVTLASDAGAEVLLFDLG